MNVLVTAGNTQTPIDRVRCITNVFTGRTGAQVALEAHRRGHAVTLLTSHPEVVRDLAPGFHPAPRHLDASVRTGRFSTCKTRWRRLSPAAGSTCSSTRPRSSDYAVAGIYAPVGRHDLRPDDRRLDARQDGGRVRRQGEEPPPGAVDAADARRPSWRTWCARRGDFAGRS